MKIARHRLPLALILLAVFALDARPAQAQSPVKTVTIDAPSIGRKTAYNIVLPADYESSGDKRYPVLYLLHGFSSNYTSWGNLGAAKAAKGLDLIVVMPDVGNSWYLNWAESGDLAAMFEGQLPSELYRALADALHMEVKQSASNDDLHQAWEKVESLRCACC